MSEKHTSNPLPELSEQDAELLSAYIDDMLSPIERAELESRLEDNIFLRDELIAMQQTVALVNQLSRLKAPRNFTITEEDVQRAESQEQPKKILRPNFAWTLAGSAAAVIVVIFGVLIVLGPIVGNVFSNVVEGLGAPVAMEQQSIALQNTSAPDARSDDTADSYDTEGNANAAGAAIEERTFIPTPTAVPTQATIVSEADENEAEEESDIVDDVVLDQADNDVAFVEESAEEADDDESAIMNEPSDEAMSSEASSSNVQTTQAAVAQSVDLSDVAQTATSLAMVFDATPTMSAPQAAPSGESDGTISSTVGGNDAGTGIIPTPENNIESAPAVQGDGDNAEAELAITNLPQTGGGGASTLENIGRILLYWVLTIFREFFQ